jgi:hypothetical protein
MGPSSLIVLTLAAIAFLQEELRSEIFGERHKKSCKG